ncbi:hypothetical protein, partial [Serratia marcescens]|uniref:hypothetical protein n=1 Tax=Serratia marcescens TaxID=615 RepID=UPI0028132C13
VGTPVLVADRYGISVGISPTPKRASGKAKIWAGYEHTDGSTYIRRGIPNLTKLTKPRSLFGRELKTTDMPSICRF